jgi:hypothetical protein
VGIGGRLDFAALNGGGVSGAREGTGAVEGSFGDLAADWLETATTGMASAAKTQIIRIIEASAIISVQFQT